ncbi:CDGSH iron-sulfur domain-containing protein, putative [Plasmodium chabaudi chabaudi]|uniref:CDGSH iron-sulfur domain-containing protein, putative n=1 Tax=Plasmodium chabaudi chabaudi TaxID=31271 RepID=A0A4V0K2S7_PLACU|nr:CDGSH iron-sulfur domain-containing protein, putative [Plasmodium chabaudi chabaudi]VTZ67148.1 CDGSH iron-sulfur domain-containing protein, putative [Plasmodium chabaudi chabaudi]|eukprot:XP_016653256.1 CDGSH iron-sulfur domain-containing protein, putative [Plasmodium chabaudi chabaudi]
MKDPLEYLEHINFNTNKFPQYNHLVESCPSENEKEKIIRICRCWQSAKFPYCDDTHKVFIENGDNVGPFVAKLVSYKLSDDERLKQQKYNEKYIKIDKKITANQYSVLNNKLNYTRFMNFNTYPFNNNKFKKSMLFSFAILTSALLYDQKEKLKHLLQVNKKLFKDIEIKKDHAGI